VSGDGVGPYILNPMVQKDFFESIDPERTLSCQARVTGAIDRVTDVTNSTKNAAKL
jgi:hypothetical protein